jgi:hypothetical protein
VFNKIGAAEIVQATRNHSKQVRLVHRLNQQALILTWKEMSSSKWNRVVDGRAILVFHRIQRFYKTFVVLSALISGLAVAALTFNEFHVVNSGLIHASEGFLCSSAITAVVSAVVATMLLFHFEGLESVTRRDLAIAWSTNSS